MDYTLLEKLRKKYEHAAEKYGALYFNMRELESRISHLLSSKGSLEIFLTQEMEFYRQMELKAKSKLEEKEKRAEFQAKVDRIMADNEAKIENYPEIFFHPAASYEMRKIVGAITDWLHYNYPVVKSLFRGGELWDEISSGIADLERFFQPPGLDTNIFLQHYVNEVTVFGESKREALERKILQTAGNGLFSLAKLLESEFTKIEKNIAGRTLHINRTEEMNVKDRWHGAKEDEALRTIIEQLKSIVDDFRLKDLAAREYKNIQKSKEDK